MIKIALVGTICVGKTSVFNALRDKFKHNPQVDFVEEGARAFLEANPDIKDRDSTETQLGVQKAILEKEQKARKDAAVVVSDRSAIDPCVYLFANGNIEGAKKGLENIKDWIPTYDYLIMFDPKNIPYFTDDIRTESTNFRQRWHEAFITFFKENNISYTLIDGTLGDKVKFVEELILQNINLA